MKFILQHRHAPALGLLTILALLGWGRVLLFGQTFLPGAMLSGFYPFGGNTNAPWNILQWDSLGQYFPWRHFAGEELRAGHIPLWNPFEFCGTPFVANAQSAVFYPLNLPFWVFDTTFAFGIAAFFHSILASFATYFLCQRWKLSRAASVIAATAFSGCGYLAAWALLPTLFSTASWLPLCLLFYEKSSDDPNARGATWGLVGALACALLAGHAQVFFYIVLALALRQLFLARRGRGFRVLVGAFIGSIMLAMLQISPTLELARYGHRAGDIATPAGWDAVRGRALQIGDWPSLLVSNWPLANGSLNENFGFIGIGVGLLMLAGLGWNSKDDKAATRAKWFALSLAIFGLLYAWATPLAELFYFGVPGVSQMGGTGRALVLWSFGAALLAGFGADFLRAKFKNSLVPAVALVIIAAELGFNVVMAQPTAPRAQIYPPTTLTTWLQSRVNANNRVLFYTSRGQWLPSELFQPPQTHPLGALPPNGATVYRLHEVNGYDSLSLRQYRAYINGEEFSRVGGKEVEGASPAFNGNLVLINNLRSSVLDDLNLRFIVVPQSVNLGANTPDGQIVFSADGCNVWERPQGAPSRLGVNAFYPGWKAGGYAPETFRFGAFVSLCALGWLSAGVALGFQISRRDAEAQRFQNK